MAVQLEPVQLDVEEAIKSVDELKNHIEQAFAEHSDNEDPRVIKTLQGLRKIYEGLDKAQAKFSQIKFDPDLPAQIQWTEQEIQRLTENLTNAKTRIKSIAEELAQIKGTSTESMLQSLKNNPMKTKQMFSRAPISQREEYAEAKRLVDDYVRVIQKADEYTKQLAERNKELHWDKTQLDAQTQAQREYNREIQKASENVGILDSRLRDLTVPTQPKRSFEGLTNAAQRFKGILSGLKSVSKKVFSAIGSVVSNVKKHFQDLRKSSEHSLNSMGKGFKKGFMTILKYGLGVRSLFFLFRKLRSAATDALGDMAKQIPEVNAQMSAFKQSMNQMKGSLGTMVQPLLNVLVPALKTVADWVTKIADKIASLFAALTGQKVIYHATAGAVDYAASLDKTGKSAKKAKKELEGYLSPIDEINKYKDKDKDDDDSGKDAGGGGVTYKAQPVDPKMLDFLKKLKEMWNKGDFYELGAMIGQALKDALDAIPWDYIQEIAAKLGKCIATLINGFVEVEGLGDTIGNTFAQLGNTFLTFFNTLLTEIHWDSVGKFFGDIVNGFVKNFDWEALGQFFANINNAFSEFVLNFATTVDWTALGTRISDGIDTMFETWDASQSAQALSEIVKGILDTLIALISETDWGQIGDKIAEYLNGIDWRGIMSRIGTTISEAAKGLLDTLIHVLEGTDWQEIGRSVADFFESIDWSGLAQRLFEGLGAALGALANFVWGIIEDAWNSVIEWWKDVAFEGGEFTIEGLFDGIVSVVKNIATWIWDNIFKPFWNGICKAFGIASPSKEMMTIGNYIMQGLLDGIKAMVNKVTEIWTKIKEKTKEVFNSVKEFVVTTVTNIKTKVTDTINNIKEKWTSTFESIKTTTKSIFDNMWESIKGVINSILRGIESMVNGVIRGFNRMIDAINNLDFDIPDWVPVVGGRSLGFNIPTLNEISLPRLAQGAVIPPNKEFMAVLGDQNRGTNIETPLSTMVDAFNQALAQNGGGSKTEITFVTPDRRTLAKYVLEGGRILQTSTGRNPFELA